MESSPEPAGGTEYAAYLLIDDLLELQRPLTPEAHDELPFIIGHQAYEPWFKLMLHELAHSDAELRADRPQAARGTVDRRFYEELWAVKGRAVAPAEAMNAVSSVRPSAADGASRPASSASAA
jgi:hypothetical protein